MMKIEHLVENVVRGFDEIGNKWIYNLDYKACNSFIIALVTVIDDDDDNDDSLPYDIYKVIIDESGRDVCKDIECVYTYRIWYNDYAEATNYSHYKARRFIDSYMNELKL